jgi:hypothetical protein
MLDARDQQTSPDASQREDRDEAHQNPNPDEPEASVLSDVNVSGRDASTQLVTPRCKTIHIRDKAHLAFVAAQPCLVCRRAPCDAHHLKIAQPRSLGRKVSDEFTVPLCRDHHQQLHRRGNEAAWWSNLEIAPLEAAKELWSTAPRREANVSSTAPGYHILQETTPGDVR